MSTLIRRSSNAAEISAAVSAFALTLAGPGGAAMVGSKSALAGAVQTTLALKADRAWLSPEDFVGADDTARIAAAFAAAPARSVIALRSGATYTVSSVDVSGKAITIMGWGAKVICTDAQGAIRKTDHANKLTIVGVEFESVTDGARAVVCESAPAISVSDDLLVDACSFKVKGAFALTLIGPREPTIRACWFYDSNGGDGVYLKDCVAPTFESCVFKGSSYTRRAIHYPGTGNGTDASPMLVNCEVMGWDVGVEVVGCDSLAIVGGTYDYCNWSLKLAAQDGGHVSHAYIGSAGANPALHISSSATASSPSHSEKLTFQNCTFTGHHEAAGYDNVQIAGAVPADHLIFDACTFTFYTRYGINFTTLGRIKIKDSTFAQRTGFGLAPIYNPTGGNDSGVVIEGNTFSNGATIAAMNVGPFCQVRNNIGCATETRGEAFLPAAASTVAVPHGCAFTPQKYEVALTPTNIEAAGKNPYVSAVDAVNVTIALTSVAAGTAGIAWRVKRGA